MNTNEVFRQFWAMSLDDYRPMNESQEAAKKLVESYLAEMDQMIDLGMGLTLVGPPGVGKTMLASIVMKAAAEKYPVRSVEMMSWIGMHLRKFETSRALDDPEAHEEWWRLYQSLEKIRKGVQVLLLDDVGKEYASGSGWSNSMFDEILRFRYNRGRATILTSNIPLDEWAPRYSESLESHFHQSSLVIEIEGDDFRRR